MPQPEPARSSDPVISAMLSIWADQGRYLARLVSDLRDEDLATQPVSGVVMNHPAWVLAHLALYPPVMTAMLRGLPFQDPKHGRFWMGTRPSSERGEYPARAELVDGYLAAREETARALAEAGPARLAEPTPLERWREQYPRLAHVLFHLMFEHESGHLGQISAWRRAGGRPSV
ncbi:MAG TPA: DinB family protein [Phycisphaerales bacterium]|nr:DinB family protein [Phycisphaerales bacterium]